MKSTIGKGKIYVFKCSSAVNSAPNCVNCFNSMVVFKRLPGLLPGKRFINVNSLRVWKTKN